MKVTVGLRCLVSAWIWTVVAASAPAHAFQGLVPAEVKQLAEQGNPDAQSKLGVMYANGIGVEMDKASAVKWYAKSAEQGYPLGLWNLAFMYIKGDGVAVDYGKARELLRKAAEKGLASAQYDLGVMLLQGLGGAPDRAEAEKWLGISAAQGYPEAEKALKELSSDS
jgi:uncharacterized protein